MATARRYTMEQIEIARKKLRNLPVKEAGRLAGKSRNFWSTTSKRYAAGLYVAGHPGLAAGCRGIGSAARLQGLFEKAPKPELVTDEEESGKDTVLPGDAGEKGKQGSSDEE